ncbi:hypothetical protein DH2020_044000 [Rehmannia glutinosa]|uniref:Glutathione S-transferase n=1 Tax=Rehmannia glutinosa TaxID=99300 RepID=A0ABR0UID5_REHGL
MSDQEWVLLDFRQSTFGSRVRIALAEKGINYENREEDLRNKSPLLLEMNPVHKKIPVLIHNGKPICESVNIIQYIDEVCKDNNGLQFLPSDPYEKAQARFWADFIDKKLHVVAMKITWHKTKEELEEAEKELIDCLKPLEQVLGDKPYFGGERLGYLDIVLGGFCSWFCAIDMGLGNISIEGECSKLMEWTKRCMERESFSKSLDEPHKVHDFVVKIRTIRGLTNKGSKIYLNA